jgi:hypothetical protein
MDWCPASSWPQEYNGNVALWQGSTSNRISIAGKEPVSSFETSAGIAVVTVTQAQTQLFHNQAGYLANSVWCCTPGLWSTLTSDSNKREPTDINKSVQRSRSIEFVLFFSDCVDVLTSSSTQKKWSGAVSKLRFYWKQNIHFLRVAFIQKGRQHIKEKEAEKFRHWECHRDLVRQHLPLPATANL